MMLKNIVKHLIFFNNWKPWFLTFQEIHKKMAFKICLLYNCLVLDTFIKLIISESFQPSRFSGLSGHLKFYKMSVWLSTAQDIKKYFLNSGWLRIIFFIVENTQDSFITILIIRTLFSDFEWGLVSLVAIFLCYDRFC